MRRRADEADIRDFTAGLLAAGESAAAFPRTDAAAFRKRCFRYWARHKLAPVVARSIVGRSDLDAAWREQAAEVMRANAGRALRQLAQVIELAGELERAGIEVIVLKGVALSLLLYGDAGYRHCGDIDVLVPGGQVDAALGVLLQKGFQPARAGQLAPGGAVSAAHWQRHHEIILLNPQGDGVVELHAQLRSQRGLVPEDFETLRAGAVPVDVGGGRCIRLGRGICWPIWRCTRCSRAGGP